VVLSSVSRDTSATNRVPSLPVTVRHTPWTLTAVADRHPPQVQLTGIESQLQIAPAFLPGRDAARCDDDAGKHYFCALGLEQYA
jgi:hypothetical protein